MNYKKIPLYRIKKVCVGYARVSPKDFPRLSKVDWWAWFCGTNRYARRTTKSKKVILLHRAIKPGKEIHHKDGDGWNNVDQNLISLSHKHHSWLPKRKAPGKSSKFRGVYWHTQSGRWRSELKRDGKRHHVGSFDSELAAVRAYNKAARGFYAIA